MRVLCALCGVYLICCIVSMCLTSISLGYTTFRADITFTRYRFIVKHRFPLRDLVMIFS